MITERISFRHGSFWPPERESTGVELGGKRMWVGFCTSGVLLAVWQMTWVPPRRVLGSVCYFYRSDSFSIAFTTNLFHLTWQDRDWL
jgi:hypothetical protein